MLIFNGHLNRAMYLDFLQNQLLILCQNVLMDMQCGCNTLEHRHIIQYTSGASQHKFSDWWIESGGQLRLRSDHPT